MSDKSEQWNLDGDCSLCRRKNYCSNRCTRNKRESEIMMRSFVASKLDEMTCGAYSELNNVKRIIREQTTAFDTEKVVEQLESLRNAEADYYYAQSNDVIDREDAIDIVKKGGVELDTIFQLWKMQKM